MYIMDCHFVTRSLCMGVNPQDQSDLKQLQSMGITGILSLQSEEDLRDRDPDWEKSVAETEGLTYRNVPITDYDSLDLKWKLPSCVKVLRELLCAGHRVYLHCTAGISRSPTVAVAYLH
jgi:protein-tyrosine phosphatase